MLAPSTAGPPRPLATATAWALVLAIANPASAEPSSTPPLRANLEVDTSAMGSDAQVIERRVVQVVGERLRSEEVLPARASDDPSTIYVRVGPAEDEAIGYVYEVRAEHAGDRVAGTDTPASCELCTEAEMLERVTDAVASTLPPLRSAVQATALSAPVQADRIEPAPPPVDAPEPTPTATTKLATIGKIGIAGIVIGTATLATGIGLVAGYHELENERQREIDANRDPEGNKINPEQADPAPTANLRAPGIALLVVGGGVLATGVALLVTDRVRAKQRSSIAFTPVFNRRFAGATMRATF